MKYHLSHLFDPDTSIENKKVFTPQLPLWRKGKHTATWTRTRGEFIRQVLYFFCLVTGSILWSLNTQAQQLKLGNNPSFINKAAILELESYNQGLRLTRVDTNNVNGIISTLSPAQQDSTNGMIVFQTSDSSLYYRTGGLWKKIMIVDSLGIQSINGDKARSQTLTLANSSSNTLGFQTPVNGAQVLNIPFASDKDTGLVNLQDQTFLGHKSFINSITLESLHPGSLLFVGGSKGKAADTVSESATNLFWDKANGELGIGTNEPTNRVEIKSGGNDSSGLKFTNLRDTNSVSSANTGLIGVDEGGNVVRAGVQRSISYPNRSENLVSDGAEASFVISPTKDAFVAYTINITTLQTLTTSQTGTVSLEIRPNGSPTWQIISSISLGDTLKILGSVLGGLSGILGVLDLSVQNLTISQNFVLSGWIPKGAQAKLVTEGNAIITYKYGQEVIME